MLYGLTGIASGITRNIFGNEEQAVFGWELLNTKLSGGEALVVGRRER